MPIPSHPVPEIARGINWRDVELLFSHAHFPADRQQLVNYARDRFASADFLAVLDSLPKRTYTSAEDIARAIQGLATPSWPSSFAP